MSTFREEENGHKYHEVEHFRQRYSWDCGVSCVLMLLPAEQRTHFLDNFSEICTEEGFGQSTWTIDLCYLLKRFGVKHCMYTSMPGVNENYKKQGYYRKIIDLDRDRVERRFRQAASDQMQVAVGSTSCEMLISHLKTRGPAVLLVDAGLLVCDLCKHNKLKAEFRRCFGGGYRGHYILLVGYSSRTDKFVYRDPALPARLCALSRRGARRARAAPGTDNDCILVYNNNP